VHTTVTARTTGNPNHTSYRLDQPGPYGWGNALLDDALYKSVQWGCRPFFTSLPHDLAAAKGSNRGKTAVMIPDFLNPKTVHK
jgi:hypothetical protein